jgi:hypothetical protein
MSNNLTALFLGDESTWDDVQFSVWSIHPLWGGYTYSVTGRGTALIGEVERGAQHQRRYELTIDPAEVRAILRLIVEHDLLATQIPHRTSFLPDEILINLSLSKDRRLFSLIVWAHDPPQPGVKAVLEAVFALKRHIEGITPAYEGPVEQ